jgi:hypothetical protein
VDIMHASISGRRATLLLLGAATVAILLLSLAEPALSAPRWGITAARGVPAEAVAQPATPAGGLALTAASVRAPAGQTDSYFVMTPLAAWVAGALGAVLLLGGARRYALAQRRGRGGRLADLTGRRPPSRDRSDRQDRRAA